VGVCRPAPPDANAATVAGPRIDLLIARVRTPFGSQVLSQLVAAGRSVEPSAK